MTAPASGTVRPARLILLLLGVAGLLLLALVTLTHNSGTRIYVWPWWAAWRILIALPPAALLVMAIRDRERPDGVLAPGLAILLLLAGAIELLAALASGHARASLGSAVDIASMACLAGVLARLDEPDRRVALGFGIGGALFLLVSLGMWLLVDAIPQIRHIAELNRQAGAEVFHLTANAFRNHLPIGHPNYTAGAVILILPWLAVLAWSSRGRRRAGWLGALILGAAVFFSSGSRGGVIGLAAIGGFAIVLAALATGWPWRRLALAATIASLLLAALVVTVPRMRRSVQAVAAREVITAGDLQRLDMIVVGLDMGAARWWIGQGPGLVSRLYPAYRARVEGGVDAAYQLHCTPVQIWAETGLPGSLLAMVLVAAALASALRRARHGGRASLTDCDRLVFAAGASLAGYTAFALTDYQLDLPFFAAGVAANIAVLARRTRGDCADPVDWWPRRLAAASCAAVVLAAWIWVTIPEWRAREQFAAAIGQLAGSGDAAAFDARVQEVAALLPDNPHLPAGAASAHLRLAYRQTDSAIAAAHLKSAIAWLEQTLAVEPNHELARFNLGWLLLERDPTTAASHLREAIRLLPDRRGVYLGLGLARLASGDAARGRDAIALEVLADPGFLTSPLWSSPLLAPHHEAVLARAAAIAAEFEDTFAAGRAPDSVRYVHHLLRWWQGDDSVVVDLAATSPSAARGFWQHVAGDAAGADFDGVIGPATPGWLVIEAALDAPQHRRELLGRFFFVRETRAATNAEMEIVERILERAGTNWRGWMQAPEGHRPPFVRVWRNERVAYPIVARNLDIPPALDACLTVENRLADTLFQFVFPARGSMPDRLLLDYVAEHDL